MDHMCILHTANPHKVDDRLLETSTFSETTYNKTSFTIGGLNNTLSIGMVTKHFPIMLQNNIMSLSVLWKYQQGFLDKDKEIDPGYSVT